MPMKGPWTQPEDLTATSLAHRALLAMPGCRSSRNMPWPVGPTPRKLVPPANEGESGTLNAFATSAPTPVHC